MLAGRPGTGKTTLGRRLAVEFGATYLRLDAAETVLQRNGIDPVGVLGYQLVHEVAAANLALGRPVLIDAVNPVPEARAGWRGYAEMAAVVQLETVLADASVHEARVSARQPDMDGQRVPSWAEVQSWDYQPWDEARDGPRLVVDMTDPDQSIPSAISAIKEKWSRSKIN